MTRYTDEEIDRMAEEVGRRAQQKIEEWSRNFRATYTTSKSYEPGTFGCHEALDRCALLAELVSDFSEHKAIQRIPRWRDLAEEAAERLAELYQEIGRVHLTADALKDSA